MRQASHWRPMGPGLALGAALAAALPLAGQAADLTIAVGGAFTSMDPHYHDLSPNHALTWHVFDRLVHPDAEQRPAPGLATEWRALDERTWEFKLRQGVRFQDGTPFTADDVVFTFARAPNVPNSPTSMGQYIRPVKRLEVVDAHTIRLHTEQPVPLIPQFMGAFAIIGRRQGEGPGGLPAEFRLQFRPRRHRHRPLSAGVLHPRRPRGLRPQPGLLGRRAALGEGHLPADRQ
ncbi:ABC transporter substrate-binding protein [Siccirubricoccus sp. G192]|uniref:ABC transporter substrate-binding protein n=1 Tax=Siccirubricoccus sp. G192 TaxID=2849651 RepID=UPI0020C1D400|nr:ABC transporter substrate-binding protein [Siccirubricoccus sp. G192]